MTPRTSSPVTTRAPHGRACHSCSPASTSIRANTANAVGPRPSAFSEDPQDPGTWANWGPSTIIPNEQATPGKFARTEMVVGADADPLSGRTRVGFVVSERCDQGRSATCPARQSDAIR